MTPEKDTHATTEELMHVVFSIQKLNKESQLGLYDK
jgi:hypothetical protein